MKLIIYHNPRCRKSREALHHLETTSHELSIINYFETPLKSDDLEQLIRALGIEAKSLIRTSEAIWKSEYKRKEMTDNELVSAMIEHPKLIERPIISNGKQAVVARPLEKLIDFLK